MVGRAKVSISSLLFLSLLLSLFPTRPVEGFVLSQRTRTPVQLSVLPDVSSAYHLLDTYSDLLQTHPLATKCSTAAVLSCLGDAIAQYGAAAQEDDKFHYDKKRGATFLVFGAVYTGFFQHYWFAYLATHIHMATPPAFFADHAVDAATLTAVTKVIVNQGVAIAGLYMPLFLFLTAWLGDMNVEQGWERAQSLYAPLVRRNWTFWIPTQFVQFAMIPDAWHIPFLSVMSLVWTIILSTMGSVSKQPQPAMASEDSVRVTSTMEKSNQEGVMMRRSGMLPTSSTDIMETQEWAFAGGKNSTETVYDSRRMAVSSNVTYS